MVEFNPSMPPYQHGASHQGLMPAEKNTAEKHAHDVLSHLTGKKETQTRRIHEA